jgi:hypothetical protein
MKWFAVFCGAIRDYSLAPALLVRETLNPL